MDTLTEQKELGLNISDGRLKFMKGHLYNLNYDVEQREKCHDVM